MLKNMHIEFPVGAAKSKLMAQAIDQIVKANPGHTVYHIATHGVITNQVYKQINKQLVDTKRVKMFTVNSARGCTVDPEDTIILDELSHHQREAMMAFLADKPVFVVSTSVHL